MIPPTVLDYTLTGLYDENIEKKPIIAIWGDSHIEGFQVDDMRKAGSVITLRCQKTGKCEYAGINIGMSGQSIADYYFAIPKYEKMFRNIARHYIVLSSIEDVLPDKESANHARFVSKPKFRFERDDYRQVAPELKKRLHSLGLDFVWNLAKQIPQKNSVRFLPSLGPVEAKAQNSKIKEKVPTNYDNGWHYLISELSALTNKPLTFVYCPEIPIIENGKICFENPRHQVASMFEQLCGESQYGTKNNFEF